MATKKQRLCIGRILLAASLAFMVGNGIFVAEYAVDMIGIPLVWYVVASNLIVWGLGCVGMTLFKADMDDDLDSKGKYQKIATMAVIADNLAEQDGQPGSTKIRHKMVASLLQNAAEHIDPPQQIEKGGDE